MEIALQPKSAIVYHAGAIGDFITTLPAIRLWKKLHGFSNLTLICRSSVGELAIDIGTADECIDIDSAVLVSLFRNEFSSEAAAFLSRFSAAMVFADESSPLLANVRAADLKQVFAQPPFPPDRTHAADYHLSLLTDPDSLPDADKAPHLVPSANAMEHSFALVPPGPPPIVLHPGSGSARKNWPFERFKELAAIFRERGFPLVWLLGPAESDLISQLDTSNLSPGLLLRPPSSPLQSAGGDGVRWSPPLPVLVAILTRCRLFIGNDSGISHLAAAAGCPTVALFGPSDPAIWAPRGKQVRVIYKKESCSPCHPSRSGNNGCAARCLAQITPEEVFMLSTSP